MWYTYQMGAAPSECFSIPLTLTLTLTRTLTRTRTRWARRRLNASRFPRCTGETTTSSCMR